MNSFKEQLEEKNKKEFYENFLDGISRYIIEGLGERIFLNEKQLLNMLSNAAVRFDMIDTYEYEFAHLKFNDLDIIIRVM